MEVFVKSERFKFNCAHFVAFKGFRERLHGHNYTVAVRLVGPLNADGYVMDFGDIKRCVRAVCESLNERFLCPLKSDVMTISVAENVTLKCEDGSHFSIPKCDCALLPIVHSTAEELAALVWTRIVESYGDQMRQRGITLLEVAVAEAPSQEARYARKLDEPPPVLKPNPCL